MGPDKKTEGGSSSASIRSSERSVWITGDNVRDRDSALTVPDVQEKQTVFNEQSFGWTIKGPILPKAGKCA